jgi:hypothetical protein
MQGERIKNGVKEGIKKADRVGLEARMIPESIPPIIGLFGRFFSEVRKQEGIETAS